MDRQGLLMFLAQAQLASGTTGMHQLFPPAHLHPQQLQMEFPQADQIPPPPAHAPPLQPPMGQIPPPPLPPIPPPGPVAHGGPQSAASTTAFLDYYSGYDVPKTGKGQQDLAHTTGSEVASLKAEVQHLREMLSAQQMMSQHHPPRSWHHAPAAGAALPRRCKFWAMGKCWNGDHCRFRHS